MHSDLVSTEAMPDLGMSHHLRTNQRRQSREEVAMGADAVFVEPHSKRSMGHVMSTLVDRGISVKTRILHEVPPAGSRVTIKFVSADEP
jgi:hypothetical protein